MNLLLDYVNKKDTRYYRFKSIICIFCANSDYAIHFCYR